MLPMALIMLGGAQGLLLPHSPPGQAAMQVAAIARLTHDLNLWTPFISLKKRTDTQFRLLLVCVYLMPAMHRHKAIYPGYLV